MHENSYGQKEHAFRAEIARLPAWDGVQALWAHRDELNLPVLESSHWRGLLPGLVNMTLARYAVAYDEGVVDALRDHIGELTEANERINNLTTIAEDAVAVGHRELVAQAEVNALLALAAFDWAVSNHDGHQQNVLVSNQQGVFGIDRGQTLKYAAVDRPSIFCAPNLDRHGLMSVFHHHIARACFNVDSTLSHTLRATAHTSASEGSSGFRLPDAVESFVRSVEREDSLKLAQLVESYFHGTSEALPAKDAVPTALARFETRLRTVRADITMMFAEIHTLVVTSSGDHSPLLRFVPTATCWPEETFPSTPTANSLIRQVQDLPWLPNGFRRPSDRTDYLHQLLHMVVRGWKGEFCHRLRQEHVVKSVVDDARRELLLAIYQVYFVPPLGDAQANVLLLSPPTIGGLALALALESFNLVAMTGNCDALEFTDVSQALLGLCMGERSEPSRWAEVIAAYGRLVSDASVRHILAAVPQDPRSETFVTENVFHAMQTSLLLGGADRRATFSSGVALQCFRQFLELFVGMGDTTTALHDEGLWEMHTRLQKIITAWAFLELQSAVGKNDDGAEAGATRSIDAALDLHAGLVSLSHQRDHSTSAIAKSARALQQRMEEFRVSKSVDELLARHKQRANVCDLAIDLFRFVPSSLKSWVEGRGGQSRPA